MGSAEQDSDGKRQQGIRESIKRFQDAAKREEQPVLVDVTSPAAAAEKKKKKKKKKSKKSSSSESSSSSKRSPTPPASKGGKKEHPIVSVKIVPSVQHTFINAYGHTKCDVSPPPTGQRIYPISACFWYIMAGSI